MKEDDCISRKQTIERLKLNFPISQGADNSRDRHRYMQAMADIQAIREMPPVAPQEPSKGHWIVQPSNKEQGERDFIWWKCSECGQVIFSETEHDRLEFHAFCGRCGADMRGEEV